MSVKNILTFRGFRSPVYSVEMISDFPTCLDNSYISLGFIFIIP